MLWLRRMIVRSRLIVRGKIKFVKMKTKVSNSAVKKVFYKNLYNVFYLKVK